MVRREEFWQKIFSITKRENIKIIEANLAGPADILEAQLQPILWYCFREEGVVSVVETSFDPQSKKRLDMILVCENRYYLIEIKRNGLGLDRYKTYSDSINLFQRDFEKLDNAQDFLKNKYEEIHKIFIEIQYFEKSSTKFKTHRAGLSKLIERQPTHWANGSFFEFGGPEDTIFSSPKDEICLAMRVLIANSENAKG